MKLDPKGKDFAALVERVNGRATAHTMAARDVAELCDRVESNLRARGISKVDMVGCTATYTPEGPGSSYARKGRFIVSNRVSIERIKAGWRVTSFVKDEFWADRKETAQIVLTDAAEKAAIAHATRETF